MRIVRTFPKSLAVVLCVVLAASGRSLAQTPDQLELFRNLTPEQQQAVLQQLNAGQLAAATDGANAQRTSDLAVEKNRRGAARVEEDATRPPLLKPADSVLLQAEMGSTDLEPGEQARVQGLVELVRSRNPYQLDRDAQLNLPGFAPIAVGGLTDEQASQRLRADPSLNKLKLSLTRLPLLVTGVRGLRPFGYELFDEASSTFSSADAPVPADYVVGSGDQFNVQLFGNQNRSYNLTVNREGAISFPELGPIRVAGLTFTDARRAIESRVQSQMIGVQANVAMSDPRTIRVFVAGEARASGSYAVSGLATMITALRVSGGIKEIGSLRDIRLMRQGEVVRRLDLYDLLMRGDTSGDAKLLPGDVIFIPTVGPTVSIDGEVRRPAIYELRGEASADELVRMAGGFTPESDAARANLARVDDSSRRVVLDVNLKETAGRSLLLRNGDALRVAALRPQLDSGVVVEGFVYRPGAVAWREGLRLTDVIGSVDELKPSADQHYVIIRRESAPDRRISVVSADLTAAWAAPGSAANAALQPRDRIIVFDLAPGRDRIIQPLLDELRLQSDITRPAEIVSVRGRVKVPGEYPLEPGMRVGDLLRAGGNLEPEAYGGSAELARYTITPTGVRETNLVTIDLAALRRGDAGANLQLQSYDYLLVQEAPDWGQQETITLRGEVRFPGTYPIRKGETLHEVLDRAGGLTTQAFPDGSAFTRADLKALEQIQLDKLAESMRADLVALSMQAARVGQGNAGEALLAGQSLLSQLQAARATGRFVIDLPELLRTEIRSSSDVTLRGGDELYIPRRRQEVTVIGEVQNSSSYLYQLKLSRSNYIEMSGGTTRRADRGQIYVVRADGRVATRSGAGGTAIRPGDTIVVPVDAERMPRLPFWQAVTQILYNVAVSVAAVNSF